MAEGKRYVNFFARVGTPEEELNAVPLGTVLLAQAGIELADVEEAEALQSNRASIDLSDPIMNFSIMVTGLTALGDEQAWWRDFVVDPKGPAQQLVDFQLHADRVGEGEVVFDISSVDSNRWINRISFPFTVVPS